MGNDRGFSARYRASDGLLAIFEADIVPEITPRSLNAAGVVISQPPTSFIAEPPSNRQSPSLTVAP